MKNAIDFVQKPYFKKEIFKRRIALKILHYISPSLWKEQRSFHLAFTNNVSWLFFYDTSCFQFIDDLKAFFCVGKNSRYSLFIFCVSFPPKIPYPNVS